MTAPARFDIAIHGSGIVALSAALALARLPLQVALLQRPAAAAAPRIDVRAYAINTAAVQLLASLKVWEALPRAAATPVYDMLIQGDADGSALRFSAWQQQVGQLAHIVDAPVLEQVLREAVRYAPHVSVLDEGTEVQASLVVHAEGRSAAQQGLGLRISPYGHTAIAARLLSDRPHGHLARQWFRHPDVLALLPMDEVDAEAAARADAAGTPAMGHGFALVWSLPQARAEELMSADEASFLLALNEATRHEAGSLRLASARAQWPLGLGSAPAVYGRGCVLLGDAAHVVHPLAGQGLNLGLGDVASLAQVLAEREPWRAPGDERLLARHARARALPVQAMAQLTDGLLRLFAEERPWARELRNRGLSLVERLGPAKRWLATQAMLR